MVPENREIFRQSLSRLLEYLLGKVDYQDHPGCGTGLWSVPGKPEGKLRDGRSAGISGIQGMPQWAKRGQVLGEDLQTLEEDLGESLTNSS